MTATSAAVAFQRRAQQHRPNDAARLTAEILRLRRDGLSARDIAAALRLHLPVVIEALQ